MTQTKRAAERAPRRLPVPAYWLIARTENARIEVLTLDRDGEQMLPVFSFGEEAEIFLGLGGLERSWRVKESRAGELVSVLYGPCAGVKEVALDPLPEMVAERTVGLVSLDRQRFIDSITTGRRALGSASRIGNRHCARASGAGGAETDCIAALEVMMYSKRRGCLYWIGSSYSFR